SSISAAVGLSFAGAGSRALLAQLSGFADPLFLDVSIDFRVMAFTAGLAIATAVLFGMAPAWIGARVAPVDALKERGREASPVFRGVFSNGFVVAQVALSLVLLVIAGLFIRTFAKLTRLPTGYDTSRIAVMDLSLRQADATPRDFVWQSTRLPSDSVMRLA